MIIVFAKIAQYFHSKAIRFMLFSIQGKRNVCAADRRTLGVLRKGLKLDNKKASVVLRPVDAVGRGGEP